MTKRCFDLIIDEIIPWGSSVFPWRLDIELWAYTSRPKVPFKPKNKKRYIFKKFYKRENVSYKVADLILIRFCLRMCVRRVVVMGSEKNL